MTSSSASPYRPSRLRWTGQPDAISCGPACVRMVLDALSNGMATLDVTHLGAMCGTDAAVGTTHEGVATAFAGLGVRSRRVLGRDAAMAMISEALERGDFALCRTLSGGSKHWVLAEASGDPGRARILDPWLGERTETLDRVEALIAPRGHEAWHVPSRQRPRAVELRPLVPEGATTAERRALVSRAHALCGPDFGGLVVDLGGYLDATTDYGVSRALFVNGAMVGAYLLNGGPIGREIPARRRQAYVGMSGVEGVGLVVDPAYRGLGYGRLLRAEPARMGYDFVWGKHAKALDNLDRWLRHRELVHDCGGYWVTARVLSREPTYAPSP